jgi:hypothetical protein
MGADLCCALSWCPRLCYQMGSAAAARVVDGSLSPLLPGCLLELLRLELLSARRLASRLLPRKAQRGHEGLTNVLRVIALQEAEKEDYEEKLKEVQDVCGPIISKVYAGAWFALREGTENAQQLGH